MVDSTSWSQTRLSVSLSRKSQVSGASLEKLPDPALKEKSSGVDAHSGPG